MGEGVWRRKRGLDRGVTKGSGEGVTAWGEEGGMGEVKEEVLEAGRE